MRACVVLFPGINAETELVHTLRDVCGAPTTVTWHTETTLPAGTDLVAIPGGFSYGDYLRTGAIAKVSPIVRAIQAHADRGGYVLGICNGFQILTEIGLLPGALTRNAQLRFACGDLHVKVVGKGPFTPKPGTVWRMPIAHGEGRYQVTPDTLKALEDQDLIGLRYCSSTGDVTEAANPNGSVGSIAGVYGYARAASGNRSGSGSKNVFGLMPHPERMSEAILGSDDGRQLFDSVIQFR